MDLASDLQPLVHLAQSENKVVTIFDIEATTFRGRPNFGITELGMLHINPRGSIATAGSFVNPEHSINRDVQKLTGITPDMVKSAPHWGDGWGQAWSLIARDHIVIGYNSSTFDAPALISQHERYAQPPLVFTQHLDARNLYKKAYATSKGTLPEVAALLGIDLSKFQGHRATNDAILTAQVMSQLWSRYPQFHNAARCVSKSSARSSSLTKPAARNPLASTEPKTKVTIPRPASETPSREDMQHHVVLYFTSKRTFSSRDLLNLGSLLAPTHSDPPKLHQAISFEVSRCLDQQLIEMLEPEDASKRSLLSQTTLTPQLKNLWSTQGRLVPVFEYLKTIAPDVNYIDVRWALDKHGARVAQPTSSSPSP